MAKTLATDGQHAPTNWLLTTSARPTVFDEGLSCGATTLLMRGGCAGSDAYNPDTRVISWLPDIFVSPISSFSVISTRAPEVFSALRGVTNDLEVKLRLRNAEQIDPRPSREHHEPLHAPQVHSPCCKMGAMLYCVRQQ